MLGRRDPQQSLFAARTCRTVCPPIHSTGAWQRQRRVFQDDDLKALFCADNGRPSCRLRC